LYLRALRKVQLEVGVDIHAHTFSDSTHAAKQFKERKFDAIFLDINMPPLDGMELARQIRRSGINHATPVIVITGSAERNLSIALFESGARLALFKPVDRKQLLRLLQLTLPDVYSEKESNS
jgi:two-component system sensor histidine kinase BarA